MNNLSFYNLLFANAWTFVWATIIALCIYFLVFRKWLVSFLDPFVLAAITSMFGFAVVLFLYLVDQIDFYYFASYLLTQFAFFGGMLFFNKVNLRWGRPRPTFRLVEQDKLLQLFFLFISVAVIGIQLTIYAVRGIPMFMESRLDAAIGGSGFGFLFRFLPFWSLCIIMLSYYFIETRNSMRYFAYVMLGVLTIFMVLGGSKSAIWIFFVTLFGYITLFSSRWSKPVKKREPLFIGVGVLFGLLIIVGTGVGEGFGNSLLFFVNRFIFTGDAYWTTYPNGCIEMLDGSQPGVVIFSDFFHLTRIIPSDQQPYPYGMGVDIYRLHAVNDFSIQGPNPRHNIMGYVLFGFWGSAIYSFIIGSVIGVARNLFFNSKNRNIFVKLIIFFLYSSIFAFEADVVLALTSINSLAIVITVSLFILIVAHLIISKVNKL